MAKKRKKTYVTGYMPVNAVAWCDYHNRGMNFKYIRRKPCLRCRPICRHLHWFPSCGECEGMKADG